MHPGARRDRDPEGRADVHGRLLEPADDPGIPGRGVADHGPGGGDHDGGEPGAEHREGHPGGGAQPRDPGHDQPRTRERCPARPVPAQGHPRHRRPRDHQRGQGQDPQAGVERIQPLDVLEPEGGREQRPEQARGDDQQQRHRGRHRSRPGHGRRDERLYGTPFTAYEQCREPAGGGEPEQGRRGRPPVRRYADQRVHAHRDGRGEQRRAGEFQTPALRARRRGRPDGERQCGDHQGGRHVDHEHRPPVPLRDEHTPQQRTGRRGHPDRTGPHGDRRGEPVGRVREPEQRQGRGLEERAEHALRGAQGDHPSHAGRENDAGRRRGEPEYADEEQPGVPVPVAEPSGDHQERGHREQVGGTGPLDLRHARPKVAAQAGLRHGQHGAVQRDDHGTRHADEE